MSITERLRFSAQKIDSAQSADDGFCSWNEANFLKLLYFLWQDSSRVPHLAHLTIHLFGQAEPLIAVCLHKKAKLKNIYGLPQLPSSDLGIPAYLMLSLSTPNNSFGLRSLFPNSGDIEQQPSILRVEQGSYLLHRSMNWNSPTLQQTYQKQDGANAFLLQKIQREIGALSPEQAFVTLATLLRERLLSIEADGSK
jgi:hypothetical protein